MKVNVEFDTQTKDLTVSMGGSVVDKVSSIYIYAYEGKGSLELCTVEPNEDESMVKVTRVMAEDKDELVLKDKSLSEEIAELLRL